MPFQKIRVNPDELLSHNGTVVYHTYDDGDFEDGPNQYIFTLDPDNDGDDLATFDVRELGVPNAALLHQHPPFLTESDPKFAAADEATRKQWGAEWHLWHQEGLPNAIKTVVRTALDLGLLLAHVPEQD